MGAIKDRTGHTYGHWTVIGPWRMAGEVRQRKVQWFCRCECGTGGWVSGSALQQGDSTQCTPCARKYRHRRRDGTVVKKRPLASGVPENTGGIAWAPSTILSWIRQAEGGDAWAQGTLTEMGVPFGGQKKKRVRRRRKRPASSAGRPPLETLTTCPAPAGTLKEAV